MNESLKKFIFKKLYDDLSNIKIIPYADSIWFIDEEKKYWYLEYYVTTGRLYWRVDFFFDFFNLFSMTKNQFEPIIIEWVEEVFNLEIEKSMPNWLNRSPQVEIVLNSNKKTTDSIRDFVTNKNQFLERLQNIESETEKYLIENKNESISHKSPLSLLMEELNLFKVDVSYELTSENSFFMKNYSNIKIKNITPSFFDSFPAVKEVLNFNSKFKS